MIKLEDIKKDAQVLGIQGNEIVRIVQVETVGDSAITVYYKGDLVNKCYFAPTRHVLSWLRQADPGLSMRQGKILN